MRRKFAIGIAIFIAACALAVLAGCGTVDYDAKFADRAKVVFELEGGKYQNHDGVTQVKHYYSLEEGESCKIVPLKAADLKRDGGFTFEGWFQNKDEVNGEIEYSNEWDFDNNVLKKEGETVLTLYAKWKAPVVYSFDFVYLDENDKEVLVASYAVNIGNTLSVIYGDKYLDLANEREGYTAIAIYYDKEHTIPFDDSRPHPGHPDGIDESYAVNLYVEFMVGSYKMVSTADDLTDLGGRGVYLLADIDMQGAELSFADFDGKEFKGNGYKVSNFTVAYNAENAALKPDLEDESRKSLYVALFGNVKNATVENVTFENMIITVHTNNSMIYRIYAAPLATSATGCTFEGVTVKGTFGYTKRTNNASAEKVFEMTKIIYSSVETTENNCVCEMTTLDVMDNSFAVVLSAQQLKSVLSRTTSFVYLLADIDMQGAELNFKNFAWKTLYGFGHTISNFTVTCTKDDLIADFDDSKQSLGVSLFGNADNVTVENVTFDNVKVVVDITGIDAEIYKIYVAPLAMSATESVFENVTVKGSVVYKSSEESDFDFENDMTVVTDRGIYSGEGEQNCSYELTFSGKIEEE